MISVSHRTAPVPVLAALAMDADGSAKLLDAVTGAARPHPAPPTITEALVLSTCNRTEVYVAANRFHAALDEVLGHLAAVGGLAAEELSGQCQVFFDEAAVRHAFCVASGLDSVVAGEHQVLGQVRSALALAQGQGTIGTELNTLFQQSLRVGKRVQTETAIGAAGRSLVGAAIDALGIADLTARRVTVVGAGSMAAVAAHTAADRGARVTIVNRTLAKAERLAGRTGGTARRFGDLPATLAETDVLISCTGALGVHFTAADLDGTPITEVIDLGLPADVDPAVETAGRRLMNIDRLVAAADAGAGGAGATAEVRAAQELVGREIADFLAARRAQAVTPTVVALRSMANDVLRHEQERLENRVPGLSEEQYAEIAQSLRRVAEKLLHQPTVNVKKAASGEQDYDHARALRELFALDPVTIDAVRRA